MTAAAAVWDGMHPGANALDYATIVKLTRTLAIIPITFALALWVSARKRKQAAQNGADTASTSGFSLKRALPTFIVLFVCASLVATGASAAGVDPAGFRAAQNAQQVLHRGGHGRYRPEHRRRGPGEVGRKTHRAGRGMLGGPSRARAWRRNTRWDSGSGIASFIAKKGSIC